MAIRVTKIVTIDQTVFQTAFTSKLLTMPKIIFTSAVTVMLITLATSPVAFADTYRWVDASGVVNYSERKPRGVPSAQITVVSNQVTRPSSPQSSNPIAEPTGNSRRVRAQSTPSLGSASLNPSQQAMLEKLQDAEAQRQAQIEQIRMDNCQRSRRVLTNLSNSGRIRVTDETGEQKVLSESDRSQRINEAQQGITANCDA